MTTLLRYTKGACYVSKMHRLINAIEYLGSGPIESRQSLFAILAAQEFYRRTRTIVGRLHLSIVSQMRVWVPVDTLFDTPVRTTKTADGQFLLTGAGSLTRISRSVCLDSLDPICLCPLLELAWGLPRCLRL